MKETFPRSLPGEPLPIYEFEVDEKMVEQFRQLMPSVAMMAIALIPGGEWTAKKVQGWLNTNYPENL